MAVNVVHLRNDGWELAFFIIYVYKTTNSIDSIFCITASPEITLMQHLNQITFSNCYFYELLNIGRFRPKTTDFKPRSVGLSVNTAGETKSCHSAAHTDHCDISAVQE